ncbi:MAG: hypothetical protein QXO75_07360 [Nitrososphaerota archaeon]
MTEENNHMSEAIRQMSICNACRYCEGYCAVWDAIEFKFVLNEGYIYHLANLCHDCRDCFYACPFNEPEHEFKLNIPKVLGQVRVDTYTANVRPKFLKFALEKPILVTTLSTFIAVAVAVIYASLFGLSKFSVLPMTAIIPDFLFKSITILVYFYTIVIWSWEGLSYWFKINEKAHLNASGLIRGIWDAIYHTNFRGGGTGCKVPDQKNRYFRLTTHSLVLFGFITALISISFYPDIYGYVGIAYLLGSMAVSIGTAGSIYMHLTEKEGSRNQKQSTMDYPFTFLLFLAGITGVLVPISTGTIWFNWNFLIHDALIIVVFLMAPYSKFIHPVFRFISLIKYNSDSVNLKH